MSVAAEQQLPKLSNKQYLQFPSDKVAIICIQGVGSDTSQIDDVCIRHKIAFHDVAYGSTGMSGDVIVLTLNASEMASREAKVTTTSSSSTVEVTVDQGLLQNSKSRICRLTNAITKYVLDTSYTKVYVTGFSHGSIVTHAAIMKIICSMDIIAPRKLKQYMDKIQVYTVGSPRYLPTDLTDFGGGNKVLNFYHQRDPYIKLIHEVMSSGNLGLFRSFIAQKIGGVEQLALETFEKHIRAFRVPELPCENICEKAMFELSDTIKRNIFVKTLPDPKYLGSWIQLNEVFKSRKPVGAHAVTNHAVTNTETEIEKKTFYERGPYYYDKLRGLVYLNRKGTLDSQPVIAKLITAFQGRDRANSVNRLKCLNMLFTPMSLQDQGFAVKIPLVRQMMLYHCNVHILYPVLSYDVRHCSIYKNASHAREGGTKGGSQVDRRTMVYFPCVGRDKKWVVKESKEGKYVIVKRPNGERYKMYLKDIKGKYRYV